MFPTPKLGVTPGPHDARVDDLDTTIIELVNDQHGVLARDQALRLGLTRRQFDRRVWQGPWTRVFDGVYRHRAAPDTWESRLMAACLTGGPGTVASHRSAAVLYGLAGGSTDLIEITCRRWRRSRHANLIAHETVALDPCDVTTKNGIPSTTVERTLLDLGAVRGRVTVQMAFDRAVSTHQTTWVRVDAALARLARSGRPGVRKLRAALITRGHGLSTPESERETQLLELLMESNLPSPVPQYRVTDNNGMLLARVDAAYPEHRIALEYDSDQEHTHPASLAADNARRNRLVAAGWTVIAARNEDIKSRGGDFVAAVAGSLQSASASKTHP